MRKIFRTGDHVRIVNGSANIGMTGLVVHVAGNIVTLISDRDHKEIQAFAKDLQEVTEMAAATAAVDLVNVQTVANGKSSSFAHTFSPLDFVEFLR